jgi:murein endopeptidase
MKGHQARVTVRAAHYSGFDADRWWEMRLGVRTEAEELEKLLLDIVRHRASSDFMNEP